LFGIPAISGCRIQAFNERFQEWVDVDSWRDLPDDGGRLKIIVES